MSELSECWAQDRILIVAYAEALSISKICYIPLFINSVFLFKAPTKISPMFKMPWNIRRHLLKHSYTQTFFPREITVQQSLIETKLEMIE